MQLFGADASSEPGKVILVLLLLSCWGLMVLESYWVIGDRAMVLRTLPLLRHATSSDLSVHHLGAIGHARLPLKLLVELLQCLHQPLRKRACSIDLVRSFPTVFLPCQVSLSLHAEKLFSRLNYCIAVLFQLSSCVCLKPLGS